MKPSRVFNVSIVVLFILLSSPASFAQGSGQSAQRELGDYIKSHYTKREVMIPMRDGVKLFTQIYEPKDTKQKYPMMFDRKNRSPVHSCPTARLAFSTNAVPVFGDRSEGVWRRMILLPMNVAVPTDRQRSA